MNDALQIAGASFLLVGALLSLVAGIGLTRFPDVLTRMHAATKPQTMGLVLMAIGFGLVVREWPVWAALLLAVLFQFLTAPVAAHMIGRGAGKIINIASVQSALARPSIAPYTATKGAVANLTKGMATDWARHGLQVNALAPGYFDTPLNAALVADPAFSTWLEKRTPAGRWGRVEELVGACVFLAAPASSFVNGHILYVDGGITASL